MSSSSSESDCSSPQPSKLPKRDERAKKVLKMSCVCASLYDATRKGHLDCVKNFLEKARKKYSTAAEIRAKVCRRDRGGETALAVAAKLGYSDIVEVLSSLYSGVDVHKTGFALHAACRANKVDCVRVLVKKLPNLVNDGDPDPEYWPINVAVENPDGAKIVEILIKAGAKPDYPGEDFISPLYRAVENQNLKMVKLLTDAGADPLFQDFDQKRPMIPLAAAATSGNLEILKILVDKAQPDDNFGYPNEPVIFAAAHARNDCLKYLLENGFPTFDSKHVDCDDDSDVSGSSCSVRSFDSDSPWREIFVLQSQNDLSSTMEILLQYGTNIREVAEVLDFSALRKDKGAFSLFTLHVNTLKVFLNHGLVELQYNCEFHPDLRKIATKFNDLKHYLRKVDRFHVEECKNSAYNVSLFLDYLPFVSFSTGRQRHCVIIGRYEMLARNLTGVKGKVFQALPKLADLCRWQVRCCIVRAHGMITPKHLEKLSLPNSIRDYLLYKKSDEKVSNLVMFG